MNLGCFQALNSFLGLRHQSPLGKETLEYRRYMPPHHRAFLYELDLVTPLYTLVHLPAITCRPVATWPQCPACRCLWEERNQDSNSPGVWRFRLEDLAPTSNMDLQV
jgi:hypothetical protein